MFEVIAMALVLSFQEMLIVFAVLLFAFTLILILKYRKVFDELITEKTQIIRSPRLSKIALYTHYLLIVLFLAVTGYSVWFGLRPSAYFVIFSLLFVTSIFLFLTSPQERKSSATRIVLVTLLLLSVAQSVTPILENRLVIFGSDQWRDIVATKLITDQGTFWQAAAYTGV
jgi:hypothetical protein